MRFRSKAFLFLGVPAVLFASCASPAIRKHETVISYPPLETVAALRPDEAARTAAKPDSEAKLEAMASVVQEEGVEDKWRFNFTPYAWLISIDGTATVNGVKSEVSEDFGDLLEQVNIVAEGRFESWKGSYGLLLDFSYVSLENDASVGPTDVNTETDIVIAVAGGLKRFVDQEVDEQGQGGVKVDGILGVAYTSLDADIDFSTLPDVSGDKDWFDPLIGLRSTWSFSPKWHGNIEALLGGFELFDGSELFTMFTALVIRQVTENGRLAFGWRSLDIDYDESSTFNLDLRISGPIIGYSWSF